MLRILYRWLEEEDEITGNPMAKMRPPIVPEQPVPVVPEHGLRRLLATCVEVPRHAATLRSVGR